MAGGLQVPPTRPVRATDGRRKERSSVSIPSAASSDQRAPIDLDRVREGDDDALRRVINEYTPLVYRVALRITQSEADAEEVLQEVFVGLPEALRQFDGGNFAGWLKVVTSRRALMLLRADRRRRNYTFAPVPHISLEDQALNKIMLERAMSRLDPTLRAVFVLKEIEGLTHSEIAEIMTISENLSQVRLHRARKAMLRFLSA